MKKFGGVVVPVAVPISSDDKLDSEGLERLVEFLIASGVHGLFANGSMGGFAFLSDGMQFTVIEAVARLARKRLPVLAGASDTSTPRVLAKIRAVQTLPVDAIVLLPPYYYIYQQPELLRFFLNAADHSQKPIMLYDNPRLVYNSLSLKTIVSLAQHPNICGVKLSNGDVFRWQQLLDSAIPRERFTFISGAGRMSALAVQLGFDGITEGLHNIVPGTACAIFDAASRGQNELSNNLQRHMNEAFKILEIAGGWRGLQLAFQYMGIASRTAVHPFDDALDDIHRAQIIEKLKLSKVAQPYPCLLPQYEHYS